jgi:hypothetical protein
MAIKPLLASEALMEDLAPVEPMKLKARVWCAGLGVTYLLLAILPLARLRPGGPEAAAPPAVLGAIALVAAATRVTYRQRAVAMVVLGLLSAVVGLGDVDATLSVAAGGIGWSLARSVTAIAIPAALFFRARYRAYARARIFLAAALVASLPYAVHLVLGFRADVDPVSIASFVAAGAIVASASGFMGSETTGAGSWIAGFLILALGAELLTRGLFGGRSSVEYLVQVGAFTLTFLTASALAGLGLFQILAWRFAADARRIDIHSRPAEPVDEPSDDGSSDWMTGS